MTSKRIERKLLHCKVWIATVNSCNHNLHLYISCCDNLVSYNMMHAAGLQVKHQP